MARRSTRRRTTPEQDDFALAQQRAIAGAIAAIRELGAPPAHTADGAAADHAAALAAALMEIAQAASARDLDTATQLAEVAAQLCTSLPLPAAHGRVWAFLVRVPAALAPLGDPALPQVESAAIAALLAEGNALAAELGAAASPDDLAALFGMSAEERALFGIDDLTGQEPVVEPEDSGVYPEDNWEPLPAFIDETRTRLATLGADLADLHGAPDDPALWQRVRRAFHTIKGGAALLPAPALARLARALQFLADDAREYHQYDRTLVDLLRQGHQALDEILTVLDVSWLGDELRAVPGQEELEARVATMREQLAHLEYPASQDDPAAPPSVLAGVSQMLYRSYVQRLPQDLRTLHAALSALRQNLAGEAALNEARRVLHGLKSRSSMVQIMPLVKVAGTAEDLLEALAVEGNITRALPLIDLLVQAEDVFYQTQFLLHRGVYDANYPALSDLAVEMCRAMGVGLERWADAVAREQAAPRTTQPALPPARPEPVESASAPGTPDPATGALPLEARDRAPEGAPPHLDPVYPSLTHPGLAHPGGGPTDDTRSDAPDALAASAVALATTPDSEPASDDDDPAPDRAEDSAARPNLETEPETYPEDTPRQHSENGAAAAAAAEASDGVAPDPATASGQPPIPDAPSPPDGVAALQAAIAQLHAAGQALPPETPEASQRARPRAGVERPRPVLAIPHQFPPRRIAALAEGEEVPVSALEQPLARLGAIEALGAATRSLLARAESLAMQQRRNAERLDAMIVRLVMEREDLRRRSQAIHEQAPPLAGRDGWDALEIDSYDSIDQTMVQLQEIVADGRVLSVELRGELERALGAGRRIAGHASGARQDLLSLRMVTLQAQWERLDQIVTATASRLGRRARLVMSADVPLDREVAAALEVPLQHIVRNAVYHGVEASEDRRYAGKEPEATITVLAQESPGGVRIEVRDDGRGIDLERVVAVAVGRGTISQSQAMALTERQKLALIFEPGISTAETANDLAGRGVGMDAVLSAVRRVRGEIEVSSEPRRGTSVILNVPRSLSSALVVVVRQNEHQIALPFEQVLDSYPVAPGDLVEAGNGRALLVGRQEGAERLVPLYEGGLLEAMPQEESDAALTLLEIRTAQGPVGMLVAEVLDVEMALIAPPPRMLGSIEAVLGFLPAAEGRARPLIDAARILGAMAPEERAVSPARPARPRRHSVLVVDDSSSVRRHLRNLFVQAGFAVREVASGIDALQEIARHGLPDLVTLDVEMPGMDGLETLNALRQSYGAELPIFMITSRAQDRHRDTARSLGATRYFNKPFNQSEVVGAAEVEIAARARPPLGTPPTGTPAVA